MNNQKTKRNILIIYASIVVLIFIALSITSRLGLKERIFHLELYETEEQAINNNLQDQKEYSYNTKMHYTSNVFRSNIFFNLTINTKSFPEYASSIVFNNFREITLFTSSEKLELDKSIDTISYFVKIKSSVWSIFILLVIILALFVFTYFDSKYGFVKNNFDKRLFIKIISITFIVGLIAHAYCYLNIMYSHDSISEFVSSSSREWEISLGRFLQPIGIVFQGNAVMPWIIGLFALLWIALSNYFIVKLFDIKSNINIFFISSFLVTFYAFTLTNATYVHDVSAYMLALLFAVLAVYVFENFKFGYFFTPVFVVLTCSLYQANFAVSVALSMFLIMKNIFDSKTSKEVIEKSVQIVCLLIIGLIIYRVAYKFVLFATGIAEASTYNSIEGATSFTITQILPSIVRTYSSAFRYYMNMPTFNNAFVNVINIVFVIFILAAIIRIIKIKKIDKQNIILLFVIILLLPFGINIVGFISKDLMHHVMQYPFVSIYVLVIMLLEYNINIQKDELIITSKKIIYLCAALTIWCSIIFSNQCYLYKHLTYQNMLSTAALLLERIYSTEGYNADVEIVFINDLISYRRGGFENLYAVKPVGFFHGPITYPKTLRLYLQNIISARLKIVDERAYPGMIEYYNNLEEVKEMRSFPYDGSCKVIEGRLVVKLGQ